MAASAPNPLQIVRSHFLVRQIGIGHAEPCEDHSLELFHACGGGRRMVVVAEQVEKSMHGEMGEMMAPLARDLPSWAK